MQPLSLTRGGKIWGEFIGRKNMAEMSLDALCIVTIFALHECK